MSRVGNAMNAWSGADKESACNKMNVLSRAGFERNAWSRADYGMQTLQDHFLYLYFF